MGSRETGVGFEVHLAQTHTFTQNGISGNRWAIRQPQREWQEMISCVCLLW